MYNDPQSYIVYDGDCPFCSQYVKLVRLRQAVGQVSLINARDDHPVVHYVKSNGVDLNNEMALVMGGKIYSGPDCMNRLALMSTDTGFFNVIMARIFASPRVARFLYPFLRIGRNLTLRVLGRSRIET